MRALLVLLLLASIAHAYELKPRTARVPPPPSPTITICPDKAITQRVINQHMPAIQRCWANEWAQREAQVTAQFSVRNGRVVEVELTGATKGLEACLAKVIHGMRFPAIGTTTTVFYPFHFKRP